MQDVIKNTTFDELKVGATASIERTLSLQDIYLFAHVSGNTNPAHMPADGKAATADIVAPSMWAGSILSAVFGTLLPGPGTLLLSQQISFRCGVHIGDTVIVSVRCAAKLAKPLATFETKILKRDGTVVAEGLAEINVPTKSMSLANRELPTLILDQKNQFPAVDRCRPQSRPHGDRGGLPRRFQLPQRRLCWPPAKASSSRS